MLWVLRIVGPTGHPRVEPTRKDHQQTLPRSCPQQCKIHARNNALIHKRPFACIFITRPPWNAARKRAYSSWRTSLNYCLTAGVTTPASSTTSIVSAPPTDLKGHIARSAAPTKITQAAGEDASAKVFWRWQQRYLDNEWLALACAGHVEIKYPCVCSLDDSMIMPHMHFSCAEHNICSVPSKTSRYVLQNLLQASPLPNRST